MVPLALQPEFLKRQHISERYCVCACMYVFFGNRNAARCWQSTQRHDESSTHKNSALAHSFQLCLLLFMCLLCLN